MLEAFHLRAGVPHIWALTHGRLRDWLGRVTDTRSSPSAEQVWRAYDDDELRLTAGVSERMLELAQLRPGMHVLDLASGRGEPAIRAAHRVAPTGFVLGVDISEAMLQMARERAHREGVSNLELRATSAESLDSLPTAHFDATLSRWGLMYLTSPLAALAAARGAMVGGGRLVAAVWAEPERVPYYTLPRQLLAAYRALPPIDPDAPGTFRYAEAGRLEDDLVASGFSIEQVEELDAVVMQAQTDADLIAWVRAFGLTQLLDDLPQPLQAAWEADLVAAAAPLRRDGVVHLGGVTRIVVARSHR